MPNAAVRERLEQWVLRNYDRKRSPEAFEIPDPVVYRSDLSELRGNKYAVLITFKKDGTPVPSPMWFGLDRGQAFMRTGLDSWKVKRIRNNPDVIIAPSDMRGKPIGPGIAATVRILPAEEHERAIAARIAAYGLGRWIYDRTVAQVYGEAAYLEVSARPAAKPDERAPLDRPSELRRSGDQLHGSSGP